MGKNDATIARPSGRHLSAIDGAPFKVERAARSFDKLARGVCGAAWGNMSEGRGELFKHVHTYNG